MAHSLAAQGPVPGSRGFGWLAATKNLVSSGAGVRLNTPATNSYRLPDVKLTFSGLTGRQGNFARPGRRFFLFDGAVFEWLKVMQAWCSSSRKLALAAGMVELLPLFAVSAPGRM
ncbi:hypothetical protein [Pseudomonas sp. SCB32]|uniref:hypothetical protein n=1 Tax=Pseudomonas sp. SCB32 TaxID=2653853 RepID=UPI001264CD1F|nr:hypothetical protein [Pseudomonas sp. SCB32]